MERRHRDLILAIQIISMCMIWVFALGISTWIIRLLLLSRRLHDVPSASIGISIVAIPVFITGASVLTYVFVGLRRGRRQANRGAARTVTALLFVLVPAAVPSAASEVVLPDNPLDGRELFAARGCGQCHAIGDRHESIGPNLGTAAFGGSFLELGAAMWNHVPGMSVRVEATETEWPQISEEDATELIAFLYYIRYLGRPGDASAGKEKFTQKGCVACHALGTKNRTVGPDLTKLESFVSPLDIGRAIWNHGPAMLTRMRQLNITPPVFVEGDLADLSAYIRREVGDRSWQGRLLAPGNPNNGRVVFEAKGCTKCHSFRGQGGVGGPDLSHSDLHRSAEGIAGTMWNHALNMNEAMLERGVGWPNFSTAELADLIAFLYFLPYRDSEGDAARGAEVFTDRACGSCHTPNPNATHPGPDLATTPAARAPAALVADMWNHAPVMKEAILGEGLPWPELSSEDLRDLFAYLRARAPAEGSF